MHDSLAAIVLGVATLLLIVTTLRLQRLAFPYAPRSDAVVHVIVASWGWIVAAALSLQCFGSLAPDRLIRAIVISCIAVQVWLRLGAISRRRRHRKTQNRFLPWPFALWPVHTTWAAIALYGITKIVRDAALRFPSDWDSLAYHIPLVDHWIQSGTLYTPGCAFWYVPGNSELLGYWLAAPFSGDFWIAFNNLPAAILLAVACVKLMSELHVPRMLRHMSAMAAVTNHVVWRQLGSNENDLAVAALFISALWYAIRIAKHQHIADIVMCSVAFGVLAGTKYLALGYAGVVGTAVIGSLLQLRRISALSQAVGCGLGGGIALGGYWYLRNYVVSGSPLFPKGLLGSADLWAAMRPENATSCLILAGRPVVLPLLWDAIASEAGPVHELAFALLPSAIAALVIVARSDGSQIHIARTRWWFLGVMVLSLLVFGMTPNVVETVPGFLNMLESKYHSVRLGFAAITLLPLALAVAVGDLICRATEAFRVPAIALEWRSLSALGIWSTVLAGLAVLLLSLLHRRVIGKPDTEPDFQFVLVAGIGCAAAAAIWLSARIIPSPAVAAAALAAIALLTETRSTAWHAGFTSSYSTLFRTTLFSALEGQMEPVCVCDYRYYPFFGSRRQHVVYRPLWVPDSVTLRGFLNESGAKVIVFRFSDDSQQRRYAAVFGIVEENRGAYRLMFEDRVYRCIRLNREMMAADSCAR